MAGISAEAQAAFSTNCHQYPQILRKPSKWPKWVHGMCCRGCIDGKHGAWCTSKNLEWAYEEANIN